MNIGLIFPNKDRRYKTIHLGLGYLVSYARIQHPDTVFHLLDTRVAKRKEVVKFLDTHFDMVCMTVFSPVYFEVIRIFNKYHNLHPGVPICLGGPYVTTIREEIFIETPADYLICGEGEVAFSELIRHLKGLTDLESIKGLIFKNGNGEIIVNPGCDHISDLDSIPYPAYDIFPMNLYPLHRIMTTRGCPYACAWCNSSSIWRQTYRQRSVQNVIGEIELLVNQYGKKIFVFGDNTFNVNLKWVNDFCDELLRKEIRILWSVSLRADNLDQELVNKMKLAGCYNAAIGIESANDGMLKAMKKSTNLEKIKDGIGMLKKAGIEVLSQFVIGSPGETLETVKESIAFAKTSGCDYSNFYTVLPFKGTYQWNWVKENGTFLVNRIHDFHTKNPRIVFVTPEFPYQDRLEAIRLVKKEGFYSNKDKKSWFFDFAKDTSLFIQRFMPASLGDKIYMFLKSIYQIRLFKKNNI
jgi:anaerobic magnesium-protoporphyrin IX monomethyl ester cyclase